MNVYLSPLSVDDAENALTWVNDPEVTQYFANMQKKISLDEEREYILRLNHSKNDKAWSVFDKDCQLFDPGDPKSWRDEYIGQCSINQIYWPARNGRIFLAIKKEYQPEPKINEDPKLMVFDVAPILAIAFCKHQDDVINDLIKVHSK